MAGESFRAGSQPSARKLNDLAESARRANRVGGAPGLAVRTGPMGTHYFPTGSVRIMARLTTSPHDLDCFAYSGADVCNAESGGSGDYCATLGYGWEQVTDDGCGNFETLTDGLVGTYCSLAAYEMNGRRAPTGKIVELIPNAFQTGYLFSWQGLQAPACGDQSGSDSGGDQSGNGCEGNSDGRHGAVMDVCCDGGSIRVVYEDDLA